jgi:hypothetical protein
VTDGLYVIDTVATITTVHRAFALAATLAEGPQKEQLLEHANAALSVCAYYIRYPKVRAKEKHYKSVQKLLILMNLHDMDKHDQETTEEMGRPR